ncbi:hypothetical protein [Actinoplanes sp. NBRC 103695]|uniref:hypothetical protein n=1 Tax=Actinoplanes sp. NBRC 103695 TaxID=3032202 RepID=UPI0024A31FDA|nr:hypothetical protein [Actinoplanes sp. NBRC 103695]GLZ02382.1 hypothetical protein Acsp02_96330 [Actinoplanes sp. NBRC 103695]
MAFHGAPTIITITSDGCRAHAYRAVHELSPTSTSGLDWFDDHGYKLEPRFDDQGQITSLVRAGAPDSGAVLARLHAVLDHAADRVRERPERVEDWGVTADDAIDTLDGLRRLPLDEIVTAGLLDSAGSASTSGGSLDGPVPHGSWLHRILFH